MPLKSYNLEVVDGVNLDSDTDMEDVLKPQIGRGGGGVGQSGYSGGGGGQSGYSGHGQSSQRYGGKNGSRHDLDNSSDSYSDTGHNYRDKQSRVSSSNNRSSNIRYRDNNRDYDDEPRYVEHITVSHETLDDLDDENETRFEVRNAGGVRRVQTKSVLFGGDTINKRIHEEFRQRAKRNESFKMALSSPKVHRRGSMKESLRQSFEDLQDGFVSLSGRTSRSGSIRSRSSSVVSLHHPEDHHHQAYQRRSSTESSDESSGGRLIRERKNDVLSRSAAGLDKLSRGLGPRRPSRERINKRTRNSSRSRSVSREHLGLKLFL